MPETSPAPDCLKHVLLLQCFWRVFVRGNLAEEVMRCLCAFARLRQVFAGSR